MAADPVVSVVTCVVPEWVICARMGPWVPDLRADTAGARSCRLGGGGEDGFPGAVVRPGLAGCYWVGS